VVGFLRTLAPTAEETAGDEPGDEEIVAQARRDPAFFALLYRRYAASVYQYCDRCLGDRDAAEEATQIVFLRALASLATCRDGRAFRSWLFAIAHNEIISQRRSYRDFAPLETATEVLDAAASPEDLALAAMERREITALLARLPVDQRDPVELRLQGLSDQEIARVLGRSPGAIRTAQYRAVRQLRTFLGAAQMKEGRRVER
jgi:RNA polymerase sigma-70 factor (ECF subfamily)